ncbi:MAG: hypothetical protein AB1847_23400 [bacterium]
MDSRQLAVTEENPIVLKKFEYTIRAKQVLKRTAEDIVELSQICHEYHQEFGYQEYVRWVRNELGLSGTYGKNLLNVYENYGDRTLSVLNFDSTAIRLLSSFLSNRRRRGLSRLGKD